jgi:glycosyltransferase involved in cell wall biosynthesis
MNISIVLGTYNRAHLLKRSLECYNSQPFKDFELVIIDDWSVDDTRELVESYASLLNIIYVRPPYKSPGTWRDSASIFNYGLKISSGELVILTHPEIMVGNQTLSAMWEHHQDGIYHAAKIYFMTKDNQKHLDEVDWQTSRLMVRDLPDFYSKHPDILGPVEEFTHHATEIHTHWESQVFSGMTRNTWREFGKMTEFNKWGSVDMDFLNRRQLLGIRNRTELDHETICIHQNHDEPFGVYVPHIRLMNEAVQALPTYRNQEEARRIPLW